MICRWTIKIRKYGEQNTRPTCTGCSWILMLSLSKYSALKLLKSSALLLLFNVFMNAKRCAAILHQPGAHLKTNRSKLHCNFHQLRKPHIFKFRMKKKISSYFIGNISTILSQLFNSSSINRRRRSFFLLLPHSELTFIISLEMTFSSQKKKKNSSSTFFQNTAELPKLI